MRVPLAALVLMLLSSPAWADDQQPPAPKKGAITVERVENGFVVAPDYKVTRIDGGTGQLAGFSAGYLLEEVLFIGGGGYWLTSGASAWDLSYGGLMVGVRMPVAHRVAFGVRGLAGIGSATLNTTLQDVLPNRDWPVMGVPAGHGGRWHMPGPAPVLVNRGDTRVEVSDNFFVFEPQTDVLFTITRRIRFGLSGGYRLTGDVDALGDRLDGATGTASLQISFGRK